MKQTKSSGNVFADMGLPNADVLQQISTMQCDLEKLKQSLSPKEGLWKPEEGEEVFVVCTEGSWVDITFDVGMWCKELKQGNVFQTKALAEAESERRAIFQDLKELAGGYEFVEGEFNHCIEIYDGKITVECHNLSQSIGQIWFKTKEQAQHAIDVLGETKLRKLF